MEKDSQLDQSVESTGDAGASETLEKTPEGSGIIETVEAADGEVPAEDEKSLDVDSKKKGSVFKELLDWIMVVVVAVVIALFINHFIITNAYIPSSSMEETIMEGDKVIGFRLAYLFSSPQRGDIVIFLYPDDESKTYIKRVIGLPGDTVEIIDGLVYINGSDEPLEEDYVNGTPYGDFGPYEVPEGCYFMLGDNRNVSKDSRYWENPYVEESKILAKAIFRYYPSFKLLTN